MSQTILSIKQSELLENLIVKYGQVVTSDDIFNETQSYMAHQQAKNLITKLTKNGWLVRIKKGLYAISDLSNRGFLSLSPYLVANLLSSHSYVSFESALQYYGMFDQLINKTISVSTKKYKTTKLGNVEYSFIKTKADYYFGWQEVVVDNKTIRIATAEKALIDIINFHKSKYAVDLVIEKLREHKKDLDFVKFNKYLSKFSTTTVKIFGFLFDLIGIDSSSAYDLIKTKGKQGTCWMLTGDKTFNAKWRIYYDKYFDKYDYSPTIRNHKS
ncbi:MAG: type IV toxin-antitoxin system AbiEi family antitoxin [Candidatus Gracilibacteria bacterium]|jgi:predicted transcriptional regulator of viral defense system